jgi:hypothetical protein
LSVQEASNRFRSSSTPTILPRPNSGAAIIYP